MDFKPAGLFNGLAFPVDLFNVLVHLLRQVMTAFRTAPLEHIATTFRGHALSEAVDARPATNFRLIRSFWHGLISSMQLLNF